MDLYNIEAADVSLILDLVRGEKTRLERAVARMEERKKTTPGARRTLMDTYLRVRRLGDIEKRLDTELLYLGQGR